MGQQKLGQRKLYFHNRYNCRLPIVGVETSQSIRLIELVKTTEKWNRLKVYERK